ncbi:hypothetical protein AAL_07323 [Moelleriella libera RCEF 2490]|uniref:DUF7707 domain-containing protein n=1 Tax=Moelleriella libera RCEF 2490 TaxID=1081109 RepID=A0A167XL73_9HYPO|nr:hypothetical protein AAL_07323 [Moelleriella libera RCEF 2490]
MPSFRASLAAAAATFFAVAGADYTINPSSVPISIRKGWCQQELSTCPLICQQSEPRTTIVNTCDAVGLFHIPNSSRFSMAEEGLTRSFPQETLQYGCLCGNNLQPNVSEYSLSLPYFICQKYVEQCQAACSSNDCKSDCAEKHPCGAQSPTRANKTTTTATAGASATNDPNAIFTGTPGQSDGGAGKTGSGSMVEVGRTYGLAVVLTGLFAGFALL